MGVAHTGGNVVIAGGGKLVDGGDMSATITSKIFDLQNAQDVGLQFHSAAAGTRAGSWAIQGSIDGDNWVALSFFNSSGSLVSSLTVTASTLHSDLVDLSGLQCKYLRCVYTASTGTGTGTVTAFRKQRR